MSLERQIQRQEYKKYLQEFFKQTHISKKALKSHLRQIGKKPSINNMLRFLLAETPYDVKETNSGPDNSSQGQ